MADISQGTHDELFNVLEARFTTLKHEFTRLDAEADSRIKRWRYAIESAFELRVEYFRRFNAKRNKTVDEEPVSAYRYHAYGYDDQDQIICVAVFQTEELPRQYTFYDYGEGHIELAEFATNLLSDGYHLKKVGRLVQHNGKTPALYGEYSRGEGHIQREIETYHYDSQDRIVRIDCAQQMQPIEFSPEAQKRMDNALDQQRRMAQMFGTQDQFKAVLPQLEQIVKGGVAQPQESTSEEVFEYNGETLMRIVKKWTQAGNPALTAPIEQVIYEVPKPRETSRTRFEAARKALVLAVIAQINQFDPALRQKTIYYNLVLSYDAVADDGVLLMLGSQAQREVWEKTTTDPSYRSLTLASLFQQEHSTVLETLPSDYERFIRVSRRDENWNDIRDLMNMVARDLNGYEWAGILDTTDDFIVYANDYEAMEDVDDEIRACVPEEKLRILRDKGLLD